jgi:hypothetical protein
MDLQKLEKNKIFQKKKQKDLTKHTTCSISINVMKTNQLRHSKPLSVRFASYANCGIVQEWNTDAPMHL